MNNDPMREAFEKWCESKGYGPTYFLDGGYVDDIMHFMFTAWQAALSQPCMTEEEAVTLIDRWLMDNGECIAYNMDGATVQVDPTIAAIGIARALLAKLPSTGGDLVAKQYESIGKVNIPTREKMGLPEQDMKRVAKTVKYLRGDMHNDDYLHFEKCLKIVCDAAMGKS